MPYILPTKGVVAIIYKEILQTSVKKSTQLGKKKDIYMCLRKEKSYVTNKEIKRCSISLIMKGI